MSMLSIEGLRLTVPQGRGRRELLRGIDLTIGEGETLGLVGESGSGKSLTARAAIGLFPRGAAVSGSIRFDGREVLTMPRRALRGYRGSEAALIFQDPRAHINPRQRIGDFLCEGMTVMGNVPRAQALKRATTLLERVGIPDPERRLRQRPRELSGGLLQRVMIASALAMHPRLLIADEATTALDVSTQNDVLHLIKELQTEAGISLILITHNLDIAAAVCDRTAVMYAGEIVETASSVGLHRVPRHPYTVGLLGARADATERHNRLAVIPGRPIGAFEAPAAACSFASRCPHVADVCYGAHPLPDPYPGGWARCLRVAEIAATATGVES
jgi:oligopeptide/dipeptide ABC transporter ATP-binding protein